RSLSEGGDWSSLLKEMPESMSFERIMVEHIISSPGDWAGAIDKLPKNLQMMFVHAYQSYLFNRMLSERMRRGLPLTKPILGDVVIPLDSNRNPQHENPVTTTPGNIDLVARQVRSGRAFVTISLFGSESKIPEGEMGDIERSVIEEEGISEKDFIVPGLPHFVGTFGAIIRMRAPLTDRRALFDIGVAGPIAGFVVAVIALVIGLRLSTVVPIQGNYGMHLGEPLLLQFASWVVIGPLGPTADVILHPVGFAAWFGLFITSLNLLPIGQLDGGHVAYALLGERQRSVAVALVPILMVFGWLGWKGWFLWVGLAGLMGLAHPPVRNPGRALGATRVLIGWIALLIFAVTFSWEPFVLR
ncbi:MAG TPA: tRNA pseudouridine(13) synthase TruD, partial [Nitrospira sp.]|nr:tRNA pseudouridine(13) synthase TruD [Nitrospira sp.]